MDRRDFLKAGVAGATMAASTGCVTARPAGGASDETMTDAEIRALLAKLSASLEEVSRRESPAGLLPVPDRAMSKEEWSDLVASDQLARKAIRSLMVVGTFGDLPEAAQLHPAVQELMRRSLPEIQEAVQQTTEMLERLDPVRRARIREHLRTDPRVVTRLGEALDQMATSLDVSGRRRTQLHALFSDAAFRLRHQDPSMLIDEVLAKAHKVEAQHGSPEELERRLAFLRGRELGEHRERLLTYAALWRAKAAEVPAEVKPADVKPAEAEGEAVEDEAPESEADVATDLSATPQPAQPGGISWGAVLLGLGLGFGGVGYVICLATASILPGAFVITAGAILLVIGLVAGMIELILWLSK